MAQAGAYSKEFFVWVGLAAGAKPVSAIRGQRAFEYDTRDEYEWIGDEEGNGGWTKVAERGQARVIASPSAEAADAFGRLQVSNPHGIWSNKNIHSKHTPQWEERTSAFGGESIAHDYDTASVKLTIPGDIGAYAIRATTRYFAYVAGKSHAPQATAVFAPGQAGLFQAVGYFDGPAGTATTYGNGIYFALDGLEYKLVIRTDTGGAGYTETETFAQSDWNLDKLDGTGPSGITLDPATAQIMTSPFQWLGVGTVTWAMSIEGKKVPIHKADHSNVDTKVYMRTPTLPIRYEIRNKTATAGATLTEICNEVTSDGGYTLPGFEYSAETGRDPLLVTGPLSNLVPVSTGVDEPVLIVRLKDTIGGEMNRQTLRYLSAALRASSNAIRFIIAHVHDPATVDGNWIEPVDGHDIGVEFAWEDAAETGARPSFTGGTVHLFHPNPVESGQAGKGTSVNEPAEFINNHGFLSQNFESNNSQLFCVMASAAAAANAYAGIDFILFE